jgi:hypothetical protein
MRTYLEDPLIRNLIRKRMALAFLPVVIVRQNFLMIEDMTKFLARLLVYFSTYWLTCVPLVRWNVYGVEMRTNNYAEGWNCRFSSIVRRHHPNIWHFIKCLQDEEASTSLAEVQFTAGNIIAGRKK